MAGKFWRANFGGQILAGKFWLKGDVEMAEQRVTKSKGRANNESLSEQKAVIPKKE